MPRAGVFFFALAYVGRDLETIGELFEVSHSEQHFQGAVDAAATANLPVGERSILGTLLPESLLYQLEAYGPRAFAEQMTRCALGCAALSCRALKSMDAVVCAGAKQVHCSEHRLSPMRGPIGRGV